MARLQGSTQRLPLDRARMTEDIGGLYDYWAALPCAGVAPAWGDSLGGDFHLVELHSRVLPIMVVVDAGPGPNLFTYRYWGSDRSPFAHAGDPTGHPVQSAAHPSIVDQVVAQYAEVVARAMPILVLSSFPLKSGLIADVQTLRLPLSGDGRTVDKVVGATQFLRHKDEFLRELAAVAE